MNTLLPTKEELKPITNEKATFYECGFNTEFDLLTEKQKLQIICDVVRETVYPNPFPNPQNDISTMNGNCHTASLVAKEYLESLGLAKNIQYVMARKRKFEPDDIVSIHGMLLVTANDNKVYQFDASPYVGYKFGSVEEITNPIYEEYVAINEEMLNFINLYKEILYLDKIKELDINKVPYYIDMCLESLQYNILGAYSGNALKALSKYIMDPILKDKVDNIVLKLRPYSKVFPEKKKIQKELLDKQIKIWQEELDDLILSGTNIKRQSELCTSIIQELKMLDSKYECIKNINGKDTRLSFMNPRYMYEEGFNTVMIKTSAYFLGQDEYIKKYITDRYKTTGEYMTDMSKKTLYTGVSPMLFSHPLGETCIRSLTGPNNIFLVKVAPEIILADKKYLRESICKDMWNKEIIWNDGKPIIWDPYVTNLVHATDDACESSLHYTFAYPEHQSMNRFMYPNPKLLYKRYND